MARGDRAAYKAHQQAKKASQATKSNTNKQLSQTSKPKKDISVSSSDFRSFIEVDNVYLHSSADTFMKSFQENVGKFPFQELLDMIKTEIFAMLYEDINNFRAMEDELVNQIKEKYKDTKTKLPFNNRKEYLKYLNDFRNEVASNPSTGYGAYNLIQFKNISIDSNKMVSNIFKEVRKLSIQRTAMKKIQSEKKISPGSEANLKRILAEEKDLQEMSPKSKKELKDNIVKVVKKYEKDINEYARELSKFLSSVILTAEAVYDPVTDYSEYKSKGLDVEKQQKTASTKIIQLLNNLGVDTYTKDRVKKTAEQLQKDIAESVKKIGPLNFVATFYNDIARD
jgi:hypothetical protein